jgi:hypothetical protein
LKPVAFDPHGGEASGAAGKLIEGLMIAVLQDSVMTLPTPETQSDDE